MKVFISACAALAITAALVIVTSVYTGNFADEILTMTDSFPEKINEKNSEDILGVLEKINEKWETGKFAVSLSVGHRELEEIEAELKGVSASAKSVSQGNYAIAVTNLREKIKNLADSERFSINGIL